MILLTELKTCDMFMAKMKPQKENNTGKIDKDILLHIHNKKLNK